MLPAMQPVPQLDAPEAGDEVDILCWRSVETMPPVEEPGGVEPPPSAGVRRTGPMVAEAMA